MSQPQLDELARTVLAQRGTPPTAGNLSAIKQAFIDNPQFYSEMVNQLNRRGRTEEVFSEVRPMMGVFRDEFDTALDRAITGPTQAAPTQAAPTQPAQSTTQAAAPIIPVETQALPSPQTQPQQSAPPVPGRNPRVSASLPPEFDQVARDSADREFVADDGFPIIPPVPISRKGDHALQRAAPDVIDAEFQGVRSTPTERAIQGRIDVEDRASLAAPRRAAQGQNNASRQGQVTEPSATQQASPRAAKPQSQAAQSVEETTFAGRQAVTFEVDGERFIVTNDGYVANETANLINERRPNVLERIKQFLQSVGRNDLAAIIRTVK